MPDLKSRRDHEAALVVAVRAVMERHGQRLAGTAGQASWGQLDSELRRALFPVLFRVYLEAAEQLAIQQGVRVERAEIVAMAREWATEQAAWAADEIATSASEEVGELLAAVRAGEVLFDGFLQKLASIFGESRAAAVAITEVTGAISAGEAALMAVAFSADDAERPRPFWFTEADGRVCEICAPLHNTPEEVWRRRYPEGPAAHPRCRCWLEWR